MDCLLVGLVKEAESMLDKIRFVLTLFYLNYLAFLAQGLMHVVKIHICLLCVQNTPKSHVCITLICDYQLR